MLLPRFDGGVFRYWDDVDVVNADELFRFPSMMKDPVAALLNEFI